MKSKYHPELRNIPLTSENCNRVVCYLENNEHPDTRFRGFGKRARAFCSARIISGHCQKGMHNDRHSTAGEHSGKEAGMTERKPVISDDDVPDYPKPEKAWAISSPFASRPFILTHTVSCLRKDMLREFEKNTGKSWRHWHESGYKIVKVLVVPNDR